MSKNSYSEMVKKKVKNKNIPGIFDRQIEMREFFARMNANIEVNYKVTNDCILIYVTIKIVDGMLIRARKHFGNWLKNINLIFLAMKSKLFVLTN